MPHIPFGEGIDQGNVFLASNRLVPASPPNFEGRLSNGRLWAELLAERFALTLTPVLAGGTNYAYLGAKVNADVTLPPGQGGLLIPSIASQVAAFLATIPPDPPPPPDDDDDGNDIDNEADPNALYIVSGGSNDLFDLLSATCPGADGTPGRCSATDAEMIAQRLLVAVNELGSEGAVYVLVPNLPPLERTPRGLALDAASQMLLASYTAAFNNLLDTGLARLEIDLGIIALRLDTASVFEGILNNPAASGVANVSDACLAGDALSGGTPCPDPSTYLFWDALHPTTAGHMAMAEAALTGRVLMAETSIQAAVDLAEPGDTVIVPPGVYTGMVAVTQSQVTIHASRQAVLDAAGALAGLRIGEGKITQDGQDLPQCPPVALSDFTLRGLTIRNAQQAGISLIGVDTFQLIGSDYVGNGQDGIHLSCSQNGLIQSNTVTGYRQRAIALGNSNTATVRDNILIDNGIGVSVENSANITIANHRQISGNTVGMLIVSQPGMPRPTTQNVTIVDNMVARNNRPLPEPDQAGNLAVLPSCTGILNLGGDDIAIRQNLVLHHHALGIGILSNPFAAADERVDPVPDSNQVVDNLSLQNAAAPVPGCATPIADIVYDRSGTGNCFSDNLVLTVVPDTLSADFPCP